MNRKNRGEIALGSMLLFGLMLLGSAVAIGGQNFLKNFNADDRSRASGISCGAGECNDGFKYGQDCSAPQSSCGQRNSEACASHGGHKSGGGSISCGGGGGGSTPAPGGGGGGGTPTCQAGSHKECVGKAPGPVSISGTAGECFKNGGTTAAPLCGWRFTGVTCLNDGALREKGIEPCCTGKTYTAADGKKYCGSPTSSATSTPAPTNSSGACGTGYVKCSFSDCPNANGCMPNTKTCNAWKAEKCPSGTPVATATPIGGVPTLVPTIALRCTLPGTNPGNCASQFKEVGSSCGTGQVCNMTSQSGANVTCSCGVATTATPTPIASGPLRCASGFNPGNCVSGQKSVGDPCISNTNQNGVCTQNSSSGTTANCSCQNSTSASLTCTGGVAVGATKCDNIIPNVVNYCRRPGGNPSRTNGGDNDMWEARYCGAGQLCINGACANAPATAQVIRLCDRETSTPECRTSSTASYGLGSACSNGGTCVSRGYINSIAGDTSTVYDMHNCQCSNVGSQTGCVQDSDCGGGVCRKIGTGSSPFICVPNEGDRCPNSANILTTSSTTNVSNASLCYIERGDTNLIWRCNDGYVPNSGRSNCIASTTTASPSPTATLRATASPSPTPTATRVATPLSTATATQRPQGTPADGSVPTLSTTAKSTATATPLATATQTPPPSPTAAPINCDSTLWFAPLWGLCLGLKAVQTAIAPAPSPTVAPTSTVTYSGGSCNSNSDCTNGYCGFPYPNAGSKVCLPGPVLAPVITPIPNTTATPAPLPQTCSPSNGIECCGQNAARSVTLSCTANGPRISYGTCFPGFDECGLPEAAPTQEANCPAGTRSDLATGQCVPITCGNGYFLNERNGTCVPVVCETGYIYDNVNGACIASGNGRVRTTCDNNVNVTSTACNASDNLYQYVCVNPGADSVSQWRRERCAEGQICSGDRCR